MADQFALDVSKFIEKAKIAPALVMRRISLDLLTKVVLRTPVGNPDLWQSPASAGYVGGRARANWATSIGAPSFKVTFDTDKSGKATIADGASTLALADGEQPVYIMNSVPYIRALEYEGHSSQAPAGMVRVTVSEFQSFVDAAARSIK